MERIIHAPRVCSKLATIVSFGLLFVLLAFASFSLNAETAFATDSGSQEMHRVYNPNSGEHFYTADTAEKDSLVSVGWNYEGIGWVAPAWSETPVYRLYSGTDHHYTRDIGERDELVRVGWRDEGIGWYSSDNRTDIPLYRQFNPNVDPNARRNNSGSHNYTTSKGENDSLVGIGWRGEGIGWYAIGEGRTIAPTPAPAPVPDTNSSSGVNNSSGPSVSDTVYITKSGTKYHRASCSSTKRSKTTAISLDAARARGYEPCRLCFH